MSSRGMYSGLLWADRSSLQSPVWGFFFPPTVTTVTTALNGQNWAITANGVPSILGLVIAPRPQNKPPTLTQIA